MRILVAHDFSPAAEAALFEAAADLERRAGELVLLHVFNTPVVPVTFDWAASEAGFGSKLELDEAIARDVRGQLIQIVDRLHARFPMVSIQTLVREGFPADNILAAAEELSVDRIVVGTHGRRGLEHLLLGSVAERIARLAKVPVLVVKPRQVTP